MLQAKRTGSGRSIDLWLPARILAEGDYELRLKGYASDGTLEETGDYYYLSIREKVIQPKQIFPFHPQLTLP